MFRQTIAPKSGPPTHVHQTEDEFFYVVSGEFKVKLGDRIMSAPAQSVMFVPRGTAHAFQNVGAEPGVLLVGVTPGGFEKIFQERQGVDAETYRTLMKSAQHGSGGAATQVSAAVLCEQASNRNVPEDAPRMNASRLSSRFDRAARAVQPCIRTGIKSHARRRNRKRLCV